MKDENPDSPEPSAPVEAPPQSGEPDPVEADFGPDPGSYYRSYRPFGSGPIPGVPCGGEGCFLRPIADLLSAVFLQVSRNHSGSLRHASASGIELMKAMRQFLDEEITMAEKFRATQGPRYQKIKID